VVAVAERTGQPLTGLRESVADSPAMDRLKQEAMAFAVAQAERMLVSTGSRLGHATNRLNDLAEGDGLGLRKMALDGGRKLAEGKGPLRSAIEAGTGAVKDRAKKAVSGLVGKGGSKGRRSGTKFVTIIEDIDVGVPVRDAYNQWTQFQEFSSFAKGVQNVDSADDVSSNWRAKIFWSSRSWKAEITEQVPDERISWKSEGDKGTTKGVVTFHPLGEDLTRVLLVMEYYPQGLFEKTGNIWRAQGRRVRLDLKHFRRFVTMRGEPTGAWRGEIRDGEVVREHDEADEEEDERRAGTEEDEEPDEYEEEAEDEEEEDDEDEEDEEEQPEDDYEADEEDEEGEAETGEAEEAEEAHEPDREGASAHR
jgi:uncharacterized membrane protein